MLVLDAVIIVVDAVLLPSCTFTVPPGVPVLVVYVLHRTPLIVCASEGCISGIEVVPVNVVVEYVNERSTMFFTEPVVENAGENVKRDEVATEAASAVALVVLPSTLFADTCARFANGRSPVTSAVRDTVAHVAIYAALMARTNWLVQVCVVATVPFPAASPTHTALGSLGR